MGEHPGRRHRGRAVRHRLVPQFATRRYRAFAYWFLAYAIAIFGTGVSDFLHLDVNIPYAGTTLLWAVILQRSSGSGTAARGPCRSTASPRAAGGLLLGHRLRHLRSRHRSGGFHRDLARPWLPASGILFGVVILIPAVAWSRSTSTAIVAFWFAYVVTRPLGASFADYISRPPPQWDRLRRRPDRGGVHGSRRGARLVPRHRSS